MKRIFPILRSLLLLCMPAMASSTAGDSVSGGIDVKKILFEHVKDTYEWHITTIGDKHVSISLPVILYSKRTGWECFSSSRLHSPSGHNGFYLASHGDNEGKVVEIDVFGIHFFLAQAETLAEQINLSMRSKMGCLSAYPLHTKIEEERSCLT